MFEWGLGTLAALPELLPSFPNCCHYDLDMPVAASDAGLSQGLLTDIKAAAHFHVKHVDQQHLLMESGQLVHACIDSAGNREQPQQLQQHALAPLFAEEGLEPQDGGLQPRISTPVVAKNAEW